MKNSCVRSGTTRQEKALEYRIRRANLPERWSEFEVVSPLIVATPPEAGVVLYCGVPSKEIVPL